MTWTQGYGSTRQWRRIVVFVVERDCGICALCGNFGANSADHKLARAFGGTDELSNLQAVHQACNAAKAAKYESKRRYALRKRAPETHPGAVA